MNIKDKYIKYFEKKGHSFIPSSPLIPENDSSSLFTTAGMQPLVPYLLGEKHPKGKRLVDVQKCFRTNDLDEIGDTTHHTFFEMLGNWSLGDYFKEDSIKWSFEFLTKELNIPKEKLAVTVFKGNDKIPCDEESAQIWQKLSIPKEKIAYLDKEDNFWIAGTTGPCGPDTEIFYFRSEDKIPEKYDPKDDRWVEIWNNVFMQYYLDEKGNITSLKQKNVDTGMGVERITSILENQTDNYKTSIWSDVIEQIEKLSGKSYEDRIYQKPIRIIADHIRAIVMILSDESNIRPSNTDQGYILRRLIRRMIRYAKKIEIEINSNWDTSLANLIINKYSKYYPELTKNKDIIINEITKEKHKFNKTLEKGLKEFEKALKTIKNNKIDKDIAFRLYDTYGFPIELTEELAKEKNIEVDIEGFKQKFKEHQEKSRAGVENKFKGGLASSGEIETKYHTATHLLNAALKQVVDKNVHQKGSNITQERMRFDFTCDHKLTKEELEKTENLVNKWIKEDLKVTYKQMSKDQAIKSNAECMFIDRYPDIVKVYSIGDISHELCGGPHVKSTKELGTFKIVKEQSSSSGVRRIKAVLE